MLVGLWIWPLLPGKGMGSMQPLTITSCTAYNRCQEGLATGTTRSCRSQIERIMSEEAAKGTLCTSAASTQGMPWSDALP